MALSVKNLLLVQIKTQGHAKSPVPYGHPAPTAPAMAWSVCGAVVRDDALTRTLT